MVVRAGRGKNLPRSRDGVGGGLKATEALWREALRHETYILGKHDIIVSWSHTGKWWRWVEEQEGWQEMIRLSSAIRHGPGSLVIKCLANNIN